MNTQEQNELLKGEQLELPIPREMGKIVPLAKHTQLSEWVDETIYITYLARVHSELYGSGFEVRFYSNLGNLNSYFAITFARRVVPALEMLYTATHEGRDISYDEPVSVTIKAAGNTLYLE